MTTTDHIAALGAAKKIIDLAIAELNKIKPDGIILEAEDCFDQGFEYIRQFTDNLKDEGKSCHSQ